MFPLWKPVPFQTRLLLPLLPAPSPGCVTASGRLIRLPVPLTHLLSPSISPAEDTSHPTLTCRAGARVRHASCSRRDQGISSQPQLSGQCGGGGRLRQGPGSCRAPGGGRGPLPARASWGILGRRPRRRGRARPPMAAHRQSSAGHMFSEFLLHTLPLETSSRLESLFAPKLPTPLSCPRLLLVVSSHVLWDTKSHASLGWSSVSWAPDAPPHAPLAKSILQMYSVWPS